MQLWLYMYLHLYKENTLEVEKMDQKREAKEGYLSVNKRKDNGIYIKML